MHNKTCTAIERDGTTCDKKVTAKGYCQKHYERFRKRGTPDIPIKKPKQCIHPGCTATQGEAKVVITKNLCGKHYLRSIRRHQRLPVGEKIHFIEFRTCEGTIQPAFLGGRDFYPNSPEYEWPTFRVISHNKNQAIDEMIAKLNSLKD